MVGGELFVAISFGLEALLSVLSLLAIILEELNMKNVLLLRQLIVVWGGFAMLRSLVGVQSKREIK